MILPVAERELRVASRRRSTSWSRVVAASAALVVGGAFVLLWIASPGVLVIGTGNEGRTLFAILTWLTFAAVLAAGLFLTSDSMSEEKREGTLGLLFLTDLRGHDVVVGKLLATSLLGFYALLAVFPIIGITLLMGSVTGEAFWKTILALVTTMFLSLGVGMFTSVLSRDSQKAVTATLAILALLVGGGFAIDALLIKFAPGLPRWSAMNRISSPAWLLYYADSFSSAIYWRSWIVHQVMTALFFLAATWLAPRTWQDSARRESSASWWHRCKSNLRQHSAAWRKRFLSANPIVWLMLRDRWQAWLAWIWMLVCVDVVLIILVRASGSGTLYAWNAGSGLLTLIFYFLASQSGRFLVEARQNGVLELLLCTPLTPRQIVQGQWRAWVRRFGPPIVVVVIMQSVLSWTTHWQMIDSMRKAFTAAVPPPPTAVGTNTSSAANTITSGVPGSLTTTTTSTVVITGGTVTGTFPTSRELDELRPLTIALTAGVVVAGALTTLCNVCAVFWFGLWTGLTGKRAAACSLRTLLFVQVIPWLVFAFISSLIMPIALLSRGTSASPGMFYVWYLATTTGMFTILSLTKDALFIMASRRKLYGEFRVRATGTVERRLVPQPAPPPIIPESPTPAG